MIRIYEKNINIYSIVFPVCMNTFNYLWFHHLDPLNTEKDKFLFFTGLASVRAGIIQTLGTFFLCSEGKNTKIPYLKDNEEGLLHLRNKYQFLKYVFANKCLTEIEKSAFLDVFQKVQKRYFTFSRLAYLWKWKRAYITIDTDLFLNPIDNEKRNSFMLYQGTKNKFFFIVSDLMRLMEMALWQNWEGCFRVSCLNPTNPYTKQIFRVVDLYNIYYHMKWNMDIIIPQFYHLWFLDGFCLHTFKRNHDRYIRKMCIREFTMTASNKNNMITKNIHEMLSEYDYTCKWKIHDDFPGDILVDAMRPYLYLHYLVTFDIVSLRLTGYYEILLHRALLRFYHLNPLFGRKRIITARNFPFGKSYFKPACCVPPITPTIVLPPSFHTESLEFATWHY